MVINNTCLKVRSAGAGGMPRSLHADRAFPTGCAGGTMMNVKNIGNWHRDDKGTNVESYLRMNEREKDIEIQKAVDRLQKHIQAILYAFDAAPPHAGRPTSKK